MQEKKQVTAFLSVMTSIIIFTPQKTCPKTSNAKCMEEKSSTHIVRDISPVLN